MVHLPMRMVKHNMTLRLPNYAGFLRRGDSVRLPLAPNMRHGTLAFEQRSVKRQRQLHIAMRRKRRYGCLPARWIERGDATDRDAKQPERMTVGQHWRDLLRQQGQRHRDDGLGVSRRMG